MAHLGLEREPHLSEFFGRDVLRSIGRPGDNGCDAAAIFEQPALVLGLKTHVAETGEMQHRPKTIAWVREVMAPIAALKAGLMPQKTTSRPLARMSGS
jgi:hypothetical protein